MPNFWKIVYSQISFIPSGFWGLVKSISLYLACACSFPDFLVGLSLFLYLNMFLCGNCTDLIFGIKYRSNYISFPFNSQLHVYCSLTIHLFPIEMKSYLCHILNAYIWDLILHSLFYFSDLIANFSYATTMFCLDFGDYRVYFDIWLRYFSLFSFSWLL